MDHESDSSARRHERVNTDLPVRIATIEADRDPLTGRSYFRASHETCASLSRGGAFIKTHELLEPGRRLLVELWLPDGAHVETIGRVAWTQRHLEPGAESACGVGVEFLGGAAEDFSLLDAFVRETGNEDEGH